MAVADNIWVVAGSSGTADFTDGTPLPGYWSLGALTNGLNYSYRAQHPTDKSIWELGRGPWNGTTLARAALYATSTGSKINFAVPPVVTITPLKVDFDEKLNAASNLADLADKPAARGILGLGSAAVKNTGTSGDAVPVLNTDYISKTLRGTAAYPATSTDLNNLVNPGFYDGATMTNAPGGSADWWYVFVERHSNSADWVVQTAKHLTAADTVYIRYKLGGTWGAWSRIPIGNQALWANNEYQTINGGAYVTVKDNGQTTNGNWMVINPAARPIQRMSMTGAINLQSGGVYSYWGACLFLLVMDAGASGCAFQSWTKVSGDNLTFTQGHAFMCHATITPWASSLIIQALQ